MKKLRDNIAEKTQEYRDWEIHFERVDGIWCYYVKQACVDDNLDSGYLEDDCSQESLLQNIRTKIDNYLNKED